MTGAGTCTFARDVTANATAEAKGEAYVSIEKQKITADLAITLATDKPTYPIAAKTDQLPYLTTAPGYAQELLIVNRGAKDADFWLDDITSDGTGTVQHAPEPL